MSEENNEGTPAEVNAEAGEKPEENKDQDSIEKEILASPDISATDFQRARSDPAFMLELVAKREKKSEAKPEGDEAKPVKKEEGEDADAAGAEDADAPKKRKRGGFKRMAERAKDEADVLKRENEYLRRQIATKAESKPWPEQKKETKTDGEPSEDDFDSHVDYLEAKNRWNTKRDIEAAFRKRDQNQATQRSRNSQNQEVTQIRKALEEQAEDSRKTRKDWDEAVATADEEMKEAGLEFSDGQVKSFAMTGQFGEIAYYLGKTEGESERLAQITNPSNFMLELGKILAKAGNSDAKPDADAKPEKKAPLPKPMGEAVKGTKASGVKDLDYWGTKASAAEYAKARKEGIV